MAQGLGPSLRPRLEPLNQVLRTEERAQDHIATPLHSPGLSAHSLAQLSTNETTVISIWTRPLNLLVLASFRLDHTSYSSQAHPIFFLANSELQWAVAGPLDVFYAKSAECLGETRAEVLQQPGQGSGTSVDGARQSCLLRGQPRQARWVV